MHRRWLVLLRHLAVLPMAVPRGVERGDATTWHGTFYTRRGERGLCSDLYRVFVKQVPSESYHVCGHDGVHSWDDTACYDARETELLATDICVDNCYAVGNGMLHCSFFSFLRPLSSFSYSLVIYPLHLLLQLIPYHRAQLITSQDMSFPSANIILSNAMPRSHQGMAASIVNTLINYSISIGLGIAGTVESQVNNGGHNRQDISRGYRGAWYMGIGLGALGIMVAGTFVFVSFCGNERKEMEEEKGGGGRKGGREGGGA